MATWTATDVMSVIVRSTLLNQRILATFYYRLDSATGSPNYETVIDEFHAQFYTAAGSMWDKLQACYPQNLTMDEAWYQKVWSQRVYRITKSPSDPGAWAVDAVTANVQASIERRGELAARNNVGALHVTCASDSTTISGGSVTAGYKVVLDALAVKMKESISTATGTCTWKPVLFRRVGTPNYSNVIEATTKTTARVMRRRTVGVGE